MPKYVIERDLPGAGKPTDSELQAISQESCGVLNGMGPAIGFPANRISQVMTIIDPPTAE